MRHRFLLAAYTAILAIGAACNVAEADKLGDLNHPLDWHPIFPQYGPNTGQIAAGRATGRVLEQPIGFSHLLHAGEMKIDCQYCHAEARKSIHAGVPPLQTCMGCHAHIRKDSPEIQKIHQAWCGKPECTIAEDAFGQPVRDPAGQPLQWNKVHDVPDYVHFNHSRHVKAGVNCTECHGQVQLQGEYVLTPIPGATGEGAVYRKVDAVMVRESTLQMGWCLDCHATHPSVDQNYGEQALQRRAELKDCWTCHK
ncbi:MAG: cytochrome c3 family protein [Myxococcota bacterium]